MAALSNSTEPADLAVHAGWIIPVEPDGQVLEQHCIVIRGGRILALLPSEKVRDLYESRESVHLPSHVLIPGLINAHGCAATSLLRAVATASAETPWAQPSASHWINEKFVRDASELAIACMLRSGTTCFNDASYFPEATAAAVERAGLRACLGMVIADSPSAWAADTHEYLSKGTAVRDQYRDNPRVSFAFAPQSAGSMPESILREIRTLADELDVPVHVQLYRTADEIEQCIKRYGKRPLARLSESGWLTPNFSAVHATHLLAEEIAELARAGAQVIHCPTANLRSASGYCPARCLLGAGVAVALGTGGNDFDMLAEMRSAALLAEGLESDAGKLSPATILRMATLNSARALGLADNTGSLVPGKWADMTAVNLDVPECQPVYDPLSQLIYAASGRQVSDVWVAGTALLRQGELTQLDLSEVLRRARNWQPRPAAAAESA